MCEFVDSLPLRLRRMVNAVAVRIKFFEIIESEAAVAADFAAVLVRAELSAFFPCCQRLLLLFSRSVVVWLLLVWSVLLLS